MEKTIQRYSRSSNILSDDKIILSIAFAALIQTLKANSRMVKLIPNMPSANNGQNKIIMITITLGFLNIDVKNNGTTFDAVFYANDGTIKDRFMIAK